MRTEENEIETCDAPVVAPQRIAPEALWLDQDISGEELVELDPLEDIYAMLVLAHLGLRMWWRQPHTEYCQEEFLEPYTETSGEPDD